MKINLSEYFPEAIKEQEEQEEYERNGGTYDKPPKGFIEQLLKEIRRVKRKRRQKS
jgi:hypothetical protein